MRATIDPAVALDCAEYLVLSTPARTLRGNLASWAPRIGPDAVIVSLMSWRGGCHTAVGACRVGNAGAAAARSVSRGGAASPSQSPGAA
ncbi:hypothetical protein ACIRH0_39705 [Streptomyces sp. NPDC093675]|uniref:hypothetical protein n=1 Tax=unclassified Streptomyces TaxID=2593676 RepID=UPI00369C459D